MFKKFKKRVKLKKKFKKKKKKWYIFLDFLLGKKRLFLTTRLVGEDSLGSADV